KEETMKADCRWVHARLEDYFTEKLDPQQRRLLSEHLESCESCTQEVESLRNVDAVVRQLFRHRMSVAQSPKPVRRRILAPLALAGAGIAVAAMLIIGLWRPQEVPAPPVAVAPAHAPIKEASSIPSPKEEIKAPNQTEPGTKPDASAPSTARNPADPPVKPGAPAFAVTDAAGYSKDLDDYRGSVLVFGLWSAN